MYKRKNSQKESECAKKVCLDKDDNDSNEVINKVGKYNDVFHFDTNKDGKKIGICKLCEEKGKRVEILRTNSSTNGLKNHLRSVHNDLFIKMFPNEAKSKDQKTLQEYTVNKILVYLCTYTLKKNNSTTLTLLQIFFNTQ